MSGWTLPPQEPNYHQKAAPTIRDPGTRAEGKLRKAPRAGASLVSHGRDRGEGREGPPCYSSRAQVSLRWARPTVGSRLALLGGR